MSFPVHRLSRLRRSPALRTLCREQSLSPAHLVAPLFAVHGSGIREPIAGLPGNFRLSCDQIGKEARDLHDLGVAGVLLFGVPAVRDGTGSEASAPDGIQQRAIAAIKQQVPDMVVIADTCMSMFTPGGHSGLVRDGRLLNDASLERLCAIALAQAAAGADLVAPSAMLDGQIGALRRALDDSGCIDCGIMAYAAKFASCLYGPFFKQGGGCPGVDYDIKRTHQMDIANGDEAMREIALDVEEGADVIMVKPGLWYLDIVWRAAQRFSMPLAVYNVSGECAMLSGAAAGGALPFEEAVLESLFCCRRAGADLIITYFARQAIAAMAGSS